MPAIGKNHPLVNLIYQKTKINKEDIVDMLRAMPECMAEAFLMSNAKENETVELGAVNLKWRIIGRRGACIIPVASVPLKSHFSAKKIEKKHPLASQLFDLMLPINREKALKKRHLSSQ